MQNLGFCYAILPVLRNLYRDEDKLKDALKRHLELFNTHPYMASAIVGAVARMEEDVRDGLIGSEEIRGVKAGIMGSYGAIGDSFFWGALKPFSSAIGVSAAALGLLPAPFLFFLSYNIPHLAMRAYGVYGGYREGLNIFEMVNRFNLPVMARRIKFLTVIIAGLLLAILFRFNDGAIFPGGTLVKGAGIFLVFLLAFEAAKRSVSPSVLIYACLLLSVGSAVAI